MVSRPTFRELLELVPFFTKVTVALFYEDHGTWYDQANGFTDTLIMQEMVDKYGDREIYMITTDLPNNAVCFVIEE